MTFIVDGTNGLTFPDTSVQAVTATNATNITSGTLPFARLPTGSVLQVVQTTSSTQVNTTSTSPVATGFTASITPKFSTSKILITFSTAILGDSGAEVGTFLYRGTSALSGNIKGAGITGSGAWCPLSTTYLDSPATTSSTTYNIYFQRNVATGTAYMGNPSITFFTLMEIAG